MIEYDPSGPGIYAARMVGIPMSIASQRAVENEPYCTLICATVQLPKLTVHLFALPPSSAVAAHTASDRRFSGGNQIPTALVARMANSCTVRGNSCTVRGNSCTVTMNEPNYDEGASWSHSLCRWRDQERVMLFLLLFVGCLR